jgi:hypothetical protein
MSDTAWQACEISSTRLNTPKRRKYGSGKKEKQGGGSKRRKQKSLIVG